MMERKNSAAIAGLVLGIVAIVVNFFAVIPFASLVALVLGIAGLVAASKGSKEARAAEGSSGIATAGIVLSIIAIVLGGIFFLSCTVCPACAAGTLACAGTMA